MSKNIDDIEDKDLIKKLGELGLNDKEARVYVALLPRPDVGSSKIIRATGLHGQFVYQALERLEELGLAKHVVQNGRKKFSANPPTRILSLVEEKRLAAQAAVRQLQGRFAGKHEQNFEVFQGATAFIAHEFQMLEECPEGGYVDSIGGGGNKYLDVMGSEMNEYERRRIEKKIRFRYISAAGRGNYLKIMAQTRQFFDYRVFPNLENGFVDTDIWDDKVIFNIFGDPVLSIVITSKDAAASYRQFFEALWAVSIK